MQLNLRQLVELRRYVLPTLVFMLLSYSLYLILADETIARLGDEDQVFEYLTALFFLGAAIFFFRNYLTHKNVFLLLLSIVFLLGFGEEIGWGQRIFHFKTPDSLANINVQNEFTFHNIELFNAHDFDQNLKTGLTKLTTINFLYKLFWLVYCVLLPIACISVRPISSLASRIRLPVPPVSIGILFLLNWIVFKATLVFLLPSGKTLQYYDTVGEVRECISAFIFMIISIYFMRLENGWQATRTDDSTTWMWKKGSGAFCRNGP